MSGPVQPSRTAKDMRADDARALIDAARVSLDHAVVLTAGWTRRHLIDVALTLAANKQASPIERLLPRGTTPHPRALRTLGPRYDETEVPWTDQELRAAHGAFNNQIRTTWAIEGERIYQRLRSRRRRAS